MTEQQQQPKKDPTDPRHMPVLSGRTINPILRLETRARPDGGVVHVAMVLAGASVRETEARVIWAREKLRSAPELYTELEIVAHGHVAEAMQRADQRRRFRALRRRRGG